MYVALNILLGNGCFQHLTDKDHLKKSYVFAFLVVTVHDEIFIKAKSFTTDIHSPLGKLFIF